MPAKVPNPRNGPKGWPEGTPYLTRLTRPEPRTLSGPEPVAERELFKAHYYALDPWSNRTSHESALAQMLRGWALYADAHRANYGTGIGEDVILGDDWEAIGRCLMGLLNGETGRIDCGTIDAFLRDTLKAEGFDCARMIEHRETAEQIERRVDAKLRKQALRDNLIILLVSLAFLAANWLLLSF